MANDQLAGTKPYSTYVAGLITEAGPLTYPENASTDELNCLLFRKGNRRRRLGVDFEIDYTLSATSVGLASIRDDAISTHEWTSVGGDGTLDFAVVQIGGFLHYYDLSSVPLGSNKKSFTTNLDTYLATGQSNAEDNPVHIVSGKGAIFVVSKKIDPIIITYSSSEDSITETAITIQIRDFEGVEDSLEPDEEPTVLSDAHSYNLKNQGWASPGAAIADPVATYKTYTSTLYPPNSKQWWTGKDASDDFQGALLAKYSSGNTLAPRGHFLLNPFYEDRTTASGVSNITVVSEDNRPEQVAFFAGRVWYMGVESTSINGHIYFSQVLTDTNRAGRCYQESDPTTEELNELLDSDGGLIVVPELGTVRGTFISGQSLVIFASNGVWSISGGESGFKATDFQVLKMTSVGCISGDTVVDVEGTPYWWAKTGIYTISAGEDGRPKAQSMSQNTIETFYQGEIPEGSKDYARGIYDQATKRMFWFYNTVAPTSSQHRYRFNAALVFDTSIGSFYPWKFSGVDANSPYIVDAIDTQHVYNITREEPVVDGEGNTVVDASLNTVVTAIEPIPNEKSFLKYLTIVPDGAGNHNWTFSVFNNGDFVDWETNDSIGKSYDSYLETGYEILEDFSAKKAVPIIKFFFSKTETAVAGGLLLSPSSCFVTAKWDWTDDEEANKWTTKRQIYSLKRLFDSGIITDSKPGQTVVSSREKFRGRGQALQLRFDSESGKDFNLYGWQVYVST
jgi:hypothetical protein